jgi:hypothetical protein
MRLRRGGWCEAGRGLGGTSPIRAAGKRRPTRGFDAGDGQTITLLLIESDLTCGGRIAHGALVLGMCRRMSAARAGADARVCVTRCPVQTWRPTDCNTSYTINKPACPTHCHARPEWAARVGLHVFR